MSVLVPALTVLLCRRQRTMAPEWAWGQGLCEAFLRESAGDAPVLVMESAAPLSTSAALDAARSPFIGVVLDDGLFWGPAGWETLRQSLVHAPHLAVIGPVSNEAAVPQQKVNPPFFYQTPSVLRLACHERRRLYEGQWQEIPALDPFAFLVRRSDLERLDPHLPLEQVPTCLARQGGMMAVALDTYVHRYPPMHELARPDLQARVPWEAKRVLDVGCAAGAFGAALKARQACHVVGIEVSPSLVDAAALRLDRVILGDVEALAPTTFTAEFDCIVCGDVLEHLRDPWRVIAGLAAWLKPGGRLVATLPNVGHWSIVVDLLQGRWDVIPFGLLCWSHLRFFTRAGVQRLFAGHGLTLEIVHGLTEDLPAVGETFLRQVVETLPDVDQEGLRTIEFVAVAQKPESH